MATTSRKALPAARKQRAAAKGRRRANASGKRVTGDETSGTRPVAAKRARGAKDPTAAKPAAAARVRRGAKAKSGAGARPDGKPKPDKGPKIVRDSFKMPQPDYALIAAVKERCRAFGVDIKKSEVLRAGLLAMRELSDERLGEVVRPLTAARAERDARKRTKPATPA